MRTLGDHRWLNDYIGLPYAANGRDATGFDCYGLVMEVYANEYGESLPDWHGDSLDIKARSGAISDVLHSGTWTEKDQPDDGDFVVCYRTRAAHHLGLFYAGGVLHCERGLGVVYEPLSRFTERFTRVTFGEWHP